MIKPRMGFVHPSPATDGLQEALLECFLGLRESFYRIRDCCCHEAESFYRIPEAFCHTGEVIFPCGRMILPQPKNHFSVRQKDPTARQRRPTVRWNDSATPAEDSGMRQKESAPRQNASAKPCQEEGGPH